MYCKKQIVVKRLRRKCVILSAVRNEKALTEVNKNGTICMHQIHNKCVLLAKVLNKLLYNAKLI